MYDVLHKRKIFLDSFAEGLEVFYLKTGINAFPDLFMELFVASDECCPDDILSILHFDNYDCEAPEGQIVMFFQNTIKKLNQSGK